MTWPQIVVALLLGANATVWITGFVTGDDVSHRARVVGVLGTIGLTITTVLVLSAGGFW